MKIKIGGYPNRLICNIHTRHMQKKYEGLSYENQTHEDYVLEAIEDAVQSVYNVFNWLWYDRRTQKVRVRIDTLGHLEYGSHSCTYCPAYACTIKSY